MPKCCKLNKTNHLKKKKKLELYSFFNTIFFVYFLIDIHVKLVQYKH